VHETAFKTGFLASANPATPEALDANAGSMKNKLPLSLSPPLLEQLF
jgi:hypothetical protein